VRRGIEPAAHVRGHVTATVLRGFDEDDRRKRPHPSGGDCTSPYPLFITYRRNRRPVRDFWNCGQDCYTSVTLWKAAGPETRPSVPRPGVWWRRD